MQGWFYAGKGVKGQEESSEFWPWGATRRSRMKQVGAGFSGAKATDGPEVYWGAGVCTENSWLSHEARMRGASSSPGMIGIL